MRFCEASIAIPILASLVIGASAGPLYPIVRPLQQTYDVPDVSKADVLIDIRSISGSLLYTLKCHSAGYTGDPEFDYSGDFECRLTSAGDRDAYSTLLTEDTHQDRDWESRGRFFAADLRGVCAGIPQFGAERSFALRGFELTLDITDARFNSTGKLQSIKLGVRVGPDPGARRPIAAAVPLPAGAPAKCKLNEYFVNPLGFKSGR